MPLYVYLATSDSALADVPALEEPSRPLAPERLPALSPENLEVEIEMAYEELASLDNYRDDTGSTPALTARAAAQVRLLHTLEEEEVRRMSATYRAKLLLPPEDGPDLLDRAAQLLEEYGYTPGSDPSVSKDDPEKA